MTVSGINILGRSLEDWQAMSAEEMVAYVRGESNLTPEQSEEIISILSEEIYEVRKVRGERFDELFIGLRQVSRNRKTSEERRAEALALLNNLIEFKTEENLDLINLDSRFKMAGIEAEAWRAEHFIDGTKEGPVTLANLELGDPVTSDRDEITYTVTLPEDTAPLIDIEDYAVPSSTDPKEVFLNVEPGTLELASVTDSELEFRVVGEDGKIAYVKIVNWKNGTFFVNQASDLMRDWPPDVLKHMRLSNGDNRSLFEIFYGEGALGDVAWAQEQVNEGLEQEGAHDDEDRPKRREDLPLLERVQNRPLEPHVWRGRKID